MKHHLILFIVDFITFGTRPIRIFLFGGLLFSVVIMAIISKLIGVDTNIGRDINLVNTIFLIISIISGYVISYTIVHIASAIKQRIE